MAKKSTDYDWEPKSRGDKLVSFLIWIIIVVLMIYGALIYKNREELFNLKKEKNLSLSKKEVIIKVKKSSKELETRYPTKQEEKKDIYQLQPKSSIDVPTVVKTTPKKEHLSLQKKNEVSSQEKVISNNIPAKKIEQIKKEEEKIKFLRVYPFSSQNLAKEFWKNISKLKAEKDEIAYKVFLYKNNYILLLKTNISADKIASIKSEVLKEGLKMDIFLAEKEAINFKGLSFSEKEKINEEMSSSSSNAEYVVQVGSFASAKAAEDLRKFIIANTQYKKVFVEPGEKAGKVYYKVRIGGFSTKDAAKVCGTTLSKNFPEKIISFWVFKRK